MPLSHHSRRTDRPPVHERHASSRLVPGVQTELAATSPPGDFYLVPTLTGARVRLEPLTMAHAPGLLEAADADGVFAWLMFDRPTTVSEAEALVDRYLSRQSTEPAWAQIDVTSGEVAGLTTYYDIAPQQRTVAIGSTWLGRRFWRTGINSEAKLLLLRRAFDELRCVRVVWHTDSLNHRSQAAIRRLGAQPEAIMRRHRIRRDGTWRDTATFSMIDEDWPEARARLDARLSSR